jgi:hypothetical protein
MNFIGVASAADVGSRVEQKICELCSRLFFREYQEQQMGAPLRTCPGCLAKRHTALPDHRLKAGE